MTDTAEQPRPTWTVPMSPLRMLRPVWGDMMSKYTAFREENERFMKCNCGSLVGGGAGLREHWQQGHFDVPAPEHTAGPEVLDRSDRKRFDESELGG